MNITIGEEQMKHCPRCCKRKPIEDFPKVTREYTDRYGDKHLYINPNTYCKTCTREKKKEYMKQRRKDKKTNA